MTSQTAPATPSVMPRASEDMQMSDELRAALEEIREEQRAQRKILENIADMAAEFHQEVFVGSAERQAILKRVDDLEAGCRIRHGNGGTLPPR